MLNHQYYYTEISFVASIQNLIQNKLITVYNLHNVQINNIIFSYFLNYFIEAELGLITNVD